MRPHERFSSPLIRDALGFAASEHAGQRRDQGGQPFLTHPVEVAWLLHDAGYSDEVVAAGILHDVIENTDTRAIELRRLFGARVAELVAAVSDDPGIPDRIERKAALRDQVAAAGECAAVIFAADKISKARELRDRAGRFARGDEDRLEHYAASLAMLEELIPEHDLVGRLRAELDALHAASPS